VLERVREKASEIPKVVLLRRMGRALSDWFWEQQIPATDLEARLDDGEDLLASAIEQVPAEELAKFRVNEALRQAIQEIRDEDWTIMLQELATHSTGLCQPHAQVLYRRYWSHLIPAMRRAREGFLTGGMPPPGQG